MGGGGGGRLFEAGRLLTFSAFRMGAYSRWALIRGWAVIRINTVLCFARKTTLLVKTGGNQEAILPLKATCISTFKINYSKTEEKLKEYWQFFVCMNHNP